MQQERCNYAHLMGTVNDSHAHSAFMGGMLLLTGIAVGLSLADRERAKPTQGDAESFPNPLQLSLAGEIIKLLK